MDDDLQDWEMLHNPETDLGNDSSLPGIQGDPPKSVIKSDYFAFGSNSNTRCGEPDDVMVPHQVIDFEAKQEDLASCENELVEDLIGTEPNKSNDCQGGVSELPVSVLEEEIKEFEGNPNIGTLAVENVLEGSNDGVSEMVINSEPEEDHLERSEPTAVHQLESAEDDNKKMVGWWWKHPFELLKFCVFRVSPIWTFSLAAAVLGIVILKKRLSRIKQKTRTIPIKLTVEDKKVSQFMVRAARLNEAFSVVRRVPIIRPISLSGGVTPWPALNLR